jgi:hypothetical protein
MNFHSVPTQSQKVNFLLIVKSLTFLGFVFILLFFHLFIIYIQLPNIKNKKGFNDSFDKLYPLMEHI